MKIYKTIALFGILPVLALASCKSEKVPGGVLTSIGDQVNLGESYKGYYFESSNSFVGRVRADGVLESYRDGNFKITGTKKGEEPVFFDYSVKDDESRNYPNFQLKGVNIGENLTSIGINGGLETNTKYRVDVKYLESTYDELIVKLDDPTLAEIVRDKDFGTISIKTGEKTGSTRLKIYLKGESEDKNKLLLDYYVRVNTPMEPGEIMEYLAGTSWTSIAFSGEQFFINFIDGETGSFNGYSSGKPIGTINFNYTVEQEFSYTFDEKRVAANVTNGSNGQITLASFYVSPIGNDIVVSEKSGISHIFNIDVE